MLIVIIGADRIGKRLAKKLIDENHNVIMIEKDIEKVNSAANSLDCLVINGDGTNLDDLRKAGATKADYFISVTGSDERNMIACGLVSKELNITHKIARVNSGYFSTASFLDNAFLGIDYIVNPYMEAAKNIIAGVEHGAIGDIMFFHNTQLQMRNLPVAYDSIFENKKISELSSLTSEKFLVAVITRGNHYIIPKGDTVIREMDNLYLVGNDKELDSIFAKEGKTKIDLKKIVIIGGSEIGQFVLEHLKGKSSQGNDVSLTDEENSSSAERSRFKSATINKFTAILKKFKKKSRDVTIIDRDYEICKQISAKYHDISVINADISDEGVFEEEGLLNSDLIITCTKNQELNIVTAVYAKSLGIKRSIALVGKTSYIPVALNLGIDVPISLNYSVVQGILKFIRKDKVETFHTISTSNIEVMQLSVTSESVLKGKAIKEIKFPHHSLIISVKRGDEDILPNGNFIIEENDTAIMIVRKESLEKVENMFIG